MKKKELVEKKRKQKELILKKGAKDIIPKIHEAKIAAIASDLEKAKRIYEEIMKIYITLDHKKKKEVYKDIKDLYVVLSFYDRV